MVDFIRRICIVLALATFLGLLFIGASLTSYAESKIEGKVPEELIEALIWPTVGEITDTYGTRWGNHFGIDIAAPEGTTVVTVADGTVSRSYYSDTYGNVVFIEHENGLETVYAHLHERHVEEGEVISEGDKLGTVGTTGRSSGNHLHFEVHHGNWNIEKSESIDPFLVLSKEQEYMFASLGEESPYGQDWQDREIASVMSSKQLNDRENELEEESVQVIVSAGDTLWAIASKFDVSVDQLKEWNDLSSDVIKVNEVLDIYHSTHTHVIQSGETLTSIARNYGVSADAIIELNNLVTDLIVPGQTIVIN
ncbi:M23 family metallopeptidase [Halalkalibacter wakoensis]|nr:M23 family metallopeptidase [Halalkalibacter wakoensis]